MDQEKLNDLEHGNLPETPATTESDFDLDALLGEDLLSILNKEEPEVAVDVLPLEPEVPVEEYKFTPPVRRPRRKKSNGTRIFYTLYIGLTIIAIAALLAVTIPLRNWLIRYEASQPEQQASQVYDTFFANPDWAMIYKLAEVQDTDFEGRDAYVQYMQAKVAAAKNPKLTYAETSAGLSGDRKYFVKLDDEKIATFTLESSTAEDEQTTNWKLGVVEVFFQRNESVTIQKLPEHIVFVNGKALDDSYTIRSVYTQAEEYLTGGVHGYRLQEQHITGLLVQPGTVTVKDSYGNEVPTKYDAATKTYVLQLPEQAAMTEDEEKVALDAAKANALYSIGAIDAGTLRKHFDPGSQVYKDIVSTPLFAQKYSKYAFDETVTAVSDFYRYSDKQFSVRVTLKLDITRRDGTVKTLEMNTTYFFTYARSGKYLADQMTNVAVHERIEEIRMTFQQDGRQVSSLFVATNAESITLPEIEVPEGQVFKGWAQQTTDEKGNITLTIRFIPDENGSAAIPEDLVMEPMTLYAVFEPKGADGQ